MEPKARVSSRPPSLAFPLSDKGGEPLQAESDSESRTCPRSSKPASKSDRKAKPFLPIQAGEAAPISNHRSPRSHIGTFMMHHDQKAVKKTYASVYCHDHIFARFSLRLEGEAAYLLGQRALPPPNSFHFSQGQGGLTFGEEVRGTPPSRAPR